MIVTFDEATHSYTVNGEIAMLSITELLHKHDIAPSYNGVNSTILAQTAEFGKEVHKDIENIVNNINYEPKTDCGKTFLEYSNKHFASAIAELQMGLNYKGYVLAGTADLVGFLKDGTPFIADNKITAKKDIEYWEWQISLENYMLHKLGKETLNGKVINWQGAQKIFVLWFNKLTGKLHSNREVELELIPDNEIERLLECELNGQKYVRKELIIEKEFATKLEDVEEQLQKQETEFIKWKQQADTYRAQLLALFKAQGIISWESPTKKLKITYVPETERVQVDNDKLKSIYPQIYSNVLKKVSKKEYLIIKERNDEHQTD